MLEKFKEKLRGGGEVYLRVKVRPGAVKSAVREVMGDEDNETIKIDIAAEPTRGKANEELIKFLAEEFGANKSKIKIISGMGERLKLIKIIK